MDKFILSCESTSDLKKEHLDERNISYICNHYFLNEVEHVEDFGTSIPLSEFYQLMEDGVITKTSQINTVDYIEYFEKFLKEGKDVLHLTLSSGLSGTYNAALLAKEELDQKYPDRKLYIIDSLNASSGFGMVVDKVADLRDAKKTIDEVKEMTEANKLKVNAWFFTTDLTYFIRGGRVSKTSGYLGKMLHICPLLNVDKEGHLIPREKVLGKKKVLSRIVEVMKERVLNHADYDDICYISHSACLEDAELLKKMVEAAFPKLKAKVQILDIGTTIGSHTGPGTVALFFIGDERTE